MPSDAALLAAVPFFQLMTDQERSGLAEVLRTVRIPAGRTIFEYGDPGDSLYVIREGEVEIFIHDDTGTRILLETAGPGGFFGEVSLLDNGPRTASVVATRDLEALQLDRAHLDGFLQRYPTAAIDLLTVVGHRLRETNRRLRHTASRNVNEELEDRSTPLQRTADRIARFSGSMPFLAINAVIFAAWIIANLGLLPGIPVFDAPPFGLLSILVSLEAIILAILVLVSQNREAAKDRLRANIEYEVNLKAEMEIAHLHEKVDGMNAKLQSRLDAIERAAGSGQRL
ncbi:MAG: DUF1003 domain-containing protein [Chloroflexota bacterium]|nr:DUF1003 domain-containing protein [Chloroflexota bacterium]